MEVPVNLRPILPWHQPTRLYTALAWSSWWVILCAAGIPFNGWFTIPMLAGLVVSQPLLLTACLRSLRANRRLSRELYDLGISELVLHGLRDNPELTPADHDDINAAYARYQLSKETKR